MTYGKEVCNALKDIRQQIADKNEIEFTTTECRSEEECQGTCPKCEAEVKFLETELHKRKQLGKVVSVAGIATVSLGMAVASMTTFSSCVKGDLPPHDEKQSDTTNYAGGIGTPPIDWNEIE